MTFSESECREQTREIKGAKYFSRLRQNPMHTREQANVIRLCLILHPISVLAHIARLHTTT